MKKNLLCLCILLGLWGISLPAQFSLTPTPWNVPNNFQNASNSSRPLGFGHNTFDIDGDGNPDLVDGKDDVTGMVFGNGTAQRYWNVYRNMGLHFSAVPVVWNVPNNVNNAFNSAFDFSQDHITMDINGDDLPDLIDGINGVGGNVYGYGTTQQYWQVYLNNGSGFNLVPIIWNVPNFEDSVRSGRALGDWHTLQDIDGDGLRDLIDGIDNSTGAVYGNGTTQKYWQVYRNIGTGFDPLPMIWNIPLDFEDSIFSGSISNLNHQTLDMTGDGKPDLIDGYNNLTGKVFGYNTAQWYWKVYPNTTTGFSLVPTIWDIPYGFDDSVNAGRASSGNHTTTDLDGDGLWDLVDGIDDLTGLVYGFGSAQQYWHFYQNTGSGFNSVPTAWVVPNNFETPSECGRTTGFSHRTMDMDGDGRHDLIEGKDELTGDVHGNGTPQRHWNIFYNRVDATAIAEELGSDLQAIYPNPTEGRVNVQLSDNFRPTEAIVYNALGQVVQHQRLKSGDVCALDIEGNAGLYLVELISATQKKRETFRVVKR
jgi:Secretion system C-terminal sorting domain